MRLANKVNGSGRQTVAEGINTKELEYFKAKELIGSDKFPIRLKGFFLHRPVINTVRVSQLLQMDSGLISRKGMLKGLRASMMRRLSSLRPGALL